MKRIICLLLTSVLLLLSAGCTSNIEIPSATNQTTAQTTRSIYDYDVDLIPYDNYSITNETDFETFLNSLDLETPKVEFSWNAWSGFGACSFIYKTKAGETTPLPISFGWKVDGVIVVVEPKTEQDTFSKIEELQLREALSQNLPEEIPLSAQAYYRYLVTTAPTENDVEPRRGDYYKLNDDVWIVYHDDFVFDDSFARAYVNLGEYQVTLITSEDLREKTFTENSIFTRLFNKSTCEEAADELVAHLKENLIVIS